MKARYCQYCRDPFHPEIHNAWHQKYCLKDDCQRARNRIGCRRWRLNHPEYSNNNEDHRVEAWRVQHPGYWRRDRRKFLSVDIMLPACRTVDCGVGMRISDRDGFTLQHVVIANTCKWQAVCMSVGTTLQNVVHGAGGWAYRFGHEQEESHATSAAGNGNPPA